jgi:hypothetical protein
MRKQKLVEAVKKTVQEETERLRKLSEDVCHSYSLKWKPTPHPNLCTLFYPFHMHRAFPFGPA